MSRLLSAPERRSILSDYGDAVTVAGVPISAQFNKEFSDAGDMSSYMPVITVTDEDVASNSIEVDTAIVVNGVNHTAATFQREGSGYTLIVLTES